VTSDGFIPERGAGGTGGACGTPRSITTGARFLGRLGTAGVLFFTVKGLLWLAVPAVLYWLR
jgi:hypothetical protein